MFTSIKKDWSFIVPAAAVWAIALVVTMLDFIFIQLTYYHFDLMVLIGVIFIVGGVTVRRMAKISLGKYFTYGLKTSKEQELITSGIYRYIRHPGYTGDILANLGITLLFHSLYGFLFMLPIIPLFLFRIKIEEQMLVAKFGEAYEEYINRTEKLIPHIY